MRKERKGRKEGAVEEPGQGNLEKELFELLQFSGSTLALSKYKRLRRNLERGNVVDMKEVVDQR